MNNVRRRRVPDKDSDGEQGGGVVGVEERGTEWGEAGCVAGPGIM